VANGGHRTALIAGSHSNGNTELFLLLNEGVPGDNSFQIDAILPERTIEKLLRAKPRRNITISARDLMNRLLALIQVLGLSLVVVASGCHAKIDPEQAKAIAEIERLGGQVNRLHGKGASKPVTSVLLGGTKATDEGLAWLKTLTGLQWLSLWDSEVSDAGLEHVKGLAQLQVLDLRGTRVTDAGLERLKGLTNLQLLGLKHTKVTSEGVKKLQQELPNCKIDY
jgi:hypothetical protein